MATPGRQVPSTSTIYRVLGARGFVAPEPHKRPKNSWTRFVAEFPNECWQADVTHVESPTVSSTRSSTSSTTTPGCVWPHGFRHHPRARRGAHPPQSG